MSAVPRPDSLYTSCTNQHQNGFCATLATVQSVCTKHEKEANQIKPMNYPVSLQRINCINKGSHPYPAVCDGKNIFTCISPVSFSGKVLSLSPEVAESAVTHMKLTILWFYSMLVIFALVTQNFSQFLANLGISHSCILCDVVWSSNV